MMADAPRSIFNKKATEKLRNPDDLERYIRVTNPSVWVLLAACVFLLAGILAWGVFGSVTTSVAATGTVVDGQAVCFLATDDVAKVDPNDDVVFGGVHMGVADVSALPLSRDEAGALLGSDYLTASLVPADWTYRVLFDGDVSGLAEGVPQAVSITVEHVSPISLILKNWG